MTIYGILPGITNTNHIHNTVLLVLKVKHYVEVLDQINVYI